MNIFFILLFTF